MLSSHTILGPRGSGKTRLLLTICRDARRLVLIDASMYVAVEYPGWVLPVSLDDFRSILSAASNTDTFRISVAVDSPDELEYVEAACAHRPGITLAFDEINQHYPTAVHTISEALRHIVLRGRHHGQRLIVNAHRPAHIPHDITSQSILWILPMSEPRDCLYVRQYTSVDPSILRCERDPMRCIVYTDVVRTDAGRTDVLRFWLRRFQVTRPEAHVRDES